jgi:hypothetical protein
MKNITRQFLHRSIQPIKEKVYSYSEDVIDSLLDRRNELTPRGFYEKYRLNGMDY